MDLCLHNHNNEAVTNLYLKTQVKQSLS